MGINYFLPFVLFCETHVSNVLSTDLIQLGSAYKATKLSQTCIISFAKSFVAQNTAGTLGLYNKNMHVIKENNQLTE